MTETKENGYIGRKELETVKRTTPGETGVLSVLSVHCISDNNGQFPLRYSSSLCLTLAEYTRAG